MADDIDIEAMLEAALQKNGEPLADEKSSRSRSKERQRDRSRSRDRKRRRESKRSRSRDRRRRSRSRRRRSRSPVSKRRSRSRDRRRSRERLPPPPRVKSPELTPEERDMRTVFCMQLAARIRPRDLEEFFSSVGRVRDVRLITDPRTKKSKGVAYVEFREVDSVNQAISLSGQKLLGVPIIVKPSNAEKNRQANPLLPILSSSSYGRETSIGGVPLSGPMKLYIGSLHFNITEDMLRGIFEPFGRIDSINLMRDPETNRSRGYAFLQFAHAEDAKRAMEQMNGFELAGRSIKVGHVTEKSAETSISSNLDSDELDQRGISLGATGRLALMAKLADGSGLQMPQVALNALNYTAQGAVGVIGAQNNTQLSPVGTQCFMLSNMFDPTKESFTMEVAREIRDDVIDECNKHGGLTHIYIDTKSPQGNVYVKCPSIATAITCVNSLHGRFFSGRVIQGNYIPVVNYHQLFPESVNTHHLLMSNNYR